MMITETCSPPVLQQPEREAMTTFAGFKITVVHEDSEHLRDAVRHVVSHRGVQPCQTPSGVRCERLLGCCFGKDLQGNRVASFVVQPLLETCLVVHEIVIRSSGSRSKKSPPLTQRPVEDLMVGVPSFNRFVEL